MERGRKLLSLSPFSCEVRKMKFGEIEFLFFSIPFLWTKISFYGQWLKDVQRFLEVQQEFSLQFRWQSFTRDFKRQILS